MRMECNQQERNFHLRIRSFAQLDLWPLLSVGQLLLLVSYSLLSMGRIPKVYLFYDDALQKR